MMKNTTKRKQKITKMQYTISSLVNPSVFYLLVLVTAVTFCSIDFILSVGLFFKKIYFLPRLYFSLSLSLALTFLQSIYLSINTFDSLIFSVNNSLFFCLFFLHLSIFSRHFVYSHLFFYLLLHVNVIEQRGRKETTNRETTTTSEREKELMCVHHFDRKKNLLFCILSFFK